MVLCRSIRADVSGNQDVAFEYIAVFIHLCQLEACGECCKSTVAVGNEACQFRTCAQTAQTSDNTQSRCAAAA